MFNENRSTFKKLVKEKGTNHTGCQEHCSLGLCFQNMVTFWRDAVYFGTFLESSTVFCLGHVYKNVSGILHFCVDRQALVFRSPRRYSSLLTSLNERGKEFLYIDTFDIINCADLVVYHGSKAINIRDCQAFITSKAEISFWHICSYSLNLKKKPKTCISWNVLFFKIWLFSVSSPKLTMIKNYTFHVKEYS